MTDIAPKRITIKDIQQATTVAELTNLWRLSQAPGVCEKPASKEVIGGKLIETCSANIPTCVSSKEASEICTALMELGFGTSPRGCGLVAQVALKWLSLCTTEEEKQEAAMVCRALAVVS
jgi:hypothetical protein